MKDEKRIPKPIRIPESVVKDIENEAAKTGSDFSKVANYRLKHFEKSLTPAITAKLQDIVNTAEELVGEFAPEQITIMKKEVKKLWQYLK